MPSNASLSSTSTPKRQSLCPGSFRQGQEAMPKGTAFWDHRAPPAPGSQEVLPPDLLEELEALLQDEIHEYRFTALAMLVYKFEKAETPEERREIVHFYLANADFVNNWDLVDASADKILGAYLYHRDRSVLWELARSGHLWRQRLAVIATFYFIRRGDFAETLQLAEFFLDHEHDLIHKAVGWMLRKSANGTSRWNMHFCGSTTGACPAPCCATPSRNSTRAAPGLSAGLDLSQAELSAWPLVMPYVRTRRMWQIWAHWMMVRSSLGSVSSTSIKLSRRL